MCTLLILLITGLLGTGKLLWGISGLALNRLLKLLSIRLLGEYWAGNEGNNSNSEVWFSSFSDEPSL
jgi:hypothetical protein